MMMKNAAAVILTTLAISILGMYEFKLLLTIYGNEINGLIQTGNQVFGYLVLIEGGLCSAYMSRLYQPLAAGDYNKVSSLYVGFKQTMRRVVMKMMLVAVAISFFYPYTINADSMSYSSIASIFFLLSIRFVAPYFLTLVPQHMIILKERKYLTVFVNGCSRIVIYILEIIMITTWKPIIQVVLLVSIVVTIGFGLWFQYIMNNLFNDVLKPGSVPDFEPGTMSKDIFVHNVSGLVFNSTANIILASFGTLNQVTIYSGYNMIITQTYTLLQNIIEGASATFGLKLASGDPTSYSVYREILVGVYFIAGVIVVVFISMINQFVELWIGPHNLLKWYDVLLMGVILYVNIVLPCLCIVRNAKGLYRETRNFIVAQTLLNCVLSILLVPIYGVTGILIAIAVARVFISMPMSYKCISNMVFPNVKHRNEEWVGNIVIVVLAVGVAQQLLSTYTLSNMNSFVRFFLHTVAVGTVAAIINAVYYCLFFSSFRLLIVRIGNTIKDLRLI